MFFVRASRAVLPLLETPMVIVAVSGAADAVPSPRTEMRDGTLGEEVADAAMDKGKKNNSDRDFIVTTGLDE